MSKSGWNFVSLVALAPEVAQRIESICQAENISCKLTSLAEFIRIQAIRELVWSHFKSKQNAAAVAAPTSKSTEAAAAEDAQIESKSATVVRDATNAAATKPPEPEDNELGNKVIEMLLGLNPGEASTLDPNMHRPFDAELYVMRYRSNISTEALRKSNRVKSLFAVQSQFRHTRFSARYNETSSQVWDTPFQVRLGSLLLYAQESGSTQRLMMGEDGSPFGECPIGTLMVTDKQVSGRGRGDNTWTAPEGCLTFTYSFSVPNGSLLPCIQYLACLGVVHAAQAAAESTLMDIAEAVAPKLVTGRVAQEVMRTRIHESCLKLPLRIKWPNDLYAVLDGFEEDSKTAPAATSAAHQTHSSFLKVGGVLCNSQMTLDPQTNRPVFTGYVGIGINVENSTPTTCLNDLLQRYVRKCWKVLGMDASLLDAVDIPQFRREDLLADVSALTDRYMAILTEENSFEPFEESYLQAWLHTGQRVHVRITDPKSQLGSSDAAGAEVEQESSAQTPNQSPLILLSGWQSLAI